MRGSIKIAQKQLRSWDTVERQIVSKVPGEGTWTECFRKFLTIHILLDGNKHRAEVPSYEQAGCCRSSRNL